MTPVRAGGARMNHKPHRNSVLPGMRWVVGSISLSLLINAGALALFAQEFGHDNLATVLLALHMASWSYVLGIVGLVLVSVWWFVGWLRAQVKRARSRYFPAEPRRRHLEKAELGGFLQQ